jgi:hypothetical protein
VALNTAQKETAQLSLRFECVQHREFEASSAMCKTCQQLENIAVQSTVIDVQL